jgi:hypothetical protein
MTMASDRTASRKYGLRKPGVLRSTLRPRIWDNSSSIAKNAKPGSRPGSNSTRTSTSLSGRNWLPRAEPNMDARRIP